MQRMIDIFLRLPVRQAAFLLLTAILVFQLYLLNTQQAASGTAVDIEAQYIEYTRKFPRQITLDHVLVDLETGAPVHLAPRVAGKNVILTFMSLTCYQCSQDLPNWVPYQQELESYRDVALVFVVTGPSRRYINHMLRRHPAFTLPVLFDSTNTLVEANGIPEVPATLLLDQQRRVLVAGSPILRPEVRRMYQAHIERLASEQGRAP